MHVDIPDHQYQKMNFDKIKDNIMKIKTLCMVQKISMKDFEQI